MSQQAGIERLRDALRDTGQPPPPAIRQEPRRGHRSIWVCLAALTLSAGAAYWVKGSRPTPLSSRVQTLQSDDAASAERARQALERAGPDAVPALLPLLQHRDLRVRLRAARTLAGIGDPAACGPLLKAARGGDFAAADALATMDDPQAREAGAWACRRLADAIVRELRSRLPVGSASPSTPWVRSRGPTAAFQFVTPYVVEWPGMLVTEAISDAYLWSAPSEADQWYGRAVEQYELYDAYVGRARLHHLCGDYVGAANMFARALTLSPASTDARRGRSESERLATLAQAMARILGPPYRVQRVLTDSTWVERSGTYYLAVAGAFHDELTLAPVAPALAVFRMRNERLELCHLAPSFSLDESAAARSAPRAYVELVATDAEARASVVVIRELLSERLERQERATHDVTIHALRDGHLSRQFMASSTALPWVGDLDGNGDTEVITWRDTSWELEAEERVPWPVVHTLVDGDYTIDTRPCPELLSVVARVLAEREATYPLDPKLSDYLARAHESLGETDEAVAAYRRAEQRYRDAAERVAQVGETDTALRYDQLSMAAEQRCALLESQADTPVAAEYPDIDTEEAG